MENRGLDTQSYQQTYSVPKNDVGAVNININGVNTPQYSQYPQYSHAPQVPYYYPIPYYYPVQQYSNNKAVQEKIAEKPAPPVEQNQIEQKPEKQKPEKQKTEPKEKPKKITAPVSDDVIKGLRQSLTQGDRDSRSYAIAKLLNLLREDVDSRKNDPRLIGLINTALHQDQPGEVNTAALIACNNGIIKGNQKTQELLKVLAQKNDKYDNSSMANSALNQMSFSSNNLNYSKPNQKPVTGNKLNLISK